MSDGLARMPGHRAVEEAGGVLDLLPFLPTDYQAAVPFYIGMALLFIAVSRAARRHSKAGRTGRNSRAGSKADAQRQMQTVPQNRVLRPNDGYWGNG